MFNLTDLPDNLPIFPLPGALLLPRTRLPLNIFEPKYLAMMEDTLKTPHRMIGMIQPQPENGEAPRLHSIGCAGRIVSFTETEDNRYMISLSGISRFRLLGTKAGFTPYLRGDLDWNSFERDLGKPEKDPSFDRPVFLKRLDDYFEASGLSLNWDSLKKAEDELLINSLSMLCPFDIEDKQALLEAPQLTDRRETLTTLIEFALRGGGDDRHLQ